MVMTREQAVNEFRRMWAWIAMETYGCKQKADKKEYMELFGFEDISNDCFLCEYAFQQRTPLEGGCEHCPIEFRDSFGNITECGELLTAYTKWYNTAWWDWKRAAEYAWEIANLEEKIVQKKEEE